MKIHEYQAKQVLSRFGVPVPRGFPVETAADAERAARELGTPVVAVKAQIHAGGRGKGGGVKIAKSPAEAGAIARSMLGMMLVTPQTGPGGQKVRRLLVEEGTDIRKETYVGVVLDRSLGLPVAMACAEGGMSIEELARERPEAILREPVDPDRGLLPFRARRLAAGLGLEGESLRKGQKFLSALCRAWLATDASLAEINPLVVTGSGDVIALDAKINFDDNALFRHPDIAEMRDPDEENAAELRAAKFDLSYVALDGNIGCMVNGAGLAMSTMDIIKHHGGEPANFLDVGGGATLEKVTEGFRIILEDPKVKAILVNIFGGIMRCDVIAEGVVAAARELGLRVPLVVRLEGTNVEKGRAILKGSGLDLIAASDMTDAASKVVAAARGR
ncbi:MAG: ADP-forming succinate--CoA ligase subunit beta [Planctomycetaceae bacterium]|nr:ADP-forming succinate--CoA ligase subunit beta [Planctomycetota bacterium]NUN53219.1 ADP-forming succinate--CoA ligase subunit beta [Planctomycetaceae bacterium]